MPEQRAVIRVGTQYQNAENLSPAKELIRAWSLLVIHENPAHPAGREIRELAAVRWYMGQSRPAAVVHCSIWFRPSYRYEDYYNSGAGKAGGHGYGKLSSAFAEACKSAGVILQKEVADRGDGAVRGALLAIARAHGYQTTNALIIEHS